LNSFSRRYRGWQTHLLKRRLKPVSLKEFRNFLAEQGITCGDVVFVHSSFDRLTHIEGGAFEIVRALQQAVTEQGLLAMPAYTHKGIMFEYVASAPVFRVDRSPSLMGLLSEVFRRMPGVVRSLHPTHSVAAWGNGAKDFVGEHHLSPSPVGPKSPFHKLLARQGKAIMLGVNTNYLTLIHTVEDIMGEQFPLKTSLKTLYSLQVIDGSGKELTVPVRVFDPWVTSRCVVSSLDSYLLNSGAMRVGIIGNLGVYFLSVAATVEKLIELAKTNKTVYRTLSLKRAYNYIYLKRKRLRIPE